MFRRTPRRRRVVAVLGGALLTATTLAAASNPASAAPVNIEASGSSITWGVKESFRSYIAGPAGGSVAVSGGAIQDAGGTFTFPGATGTYDTTGPAATAQGTGSVRFLGYHGNPEPDLDLVLSDVRVNVTGSTGTIVVDAVLNGVASNDLVIANITSVVPTGSDPVAVGAAPTTLTSAGAALFSMPGSGAQFYAPGTALDPVSFTLDLPAGSSDPDPEPEPPAGGLTWKISSNVFATSSSLSPVHELAGGVTETVTHVTSAHPNGASDGFVFPVAAATYNPDAGPTDALVDVDLAGSVTFGNTAQGGYRIRYADLSVEIDGGGDGRIAAVVSYCTGAAGSSPCSSPYTSTSGSITLATITDAAVSTADDQVTVTGTPDYVSQDNGAQPLHRQWNPALIGSFADGFTTGFLSPAVPSLVAHFRDTSAGASTPNKAPAPFSLVVGYAPADAVQLTTSLASGPLTISIGGSMINLGPLTLNQSGTAFTTGSTPMAVTVTDLRGTSSGWAVQAQVTDFARNGGGGTIPKGGLTWAPSLVAGSTNAPGAAAGSASAVDGAQLGQATGQGTATFTAPLTLQAPTTTPSGAYTSTLTLTAI